MPVSAQLSGALAQNLQQRAYFNQAFKDLERTIAETEERIRAAAGSIFENEIPNLNARLPEGYSISTYRVMITDDDQRYMQDDDPAHGMLLPATVEIYLDPPERIMKDQKEDSKQLGKRKDQAGLAHKMTAAGKYFISKLRSSIDPYDTSGEDQEIRDQHFIKDLMVPYLSSLIAEGKKNAKEGKEAPFSDLYHHVLEAWRYSTTKEVREGIFTVLGESESRTPPWDFLGMTPPTFYNYVGNMYKSTPNPEKRSMLKLEALSHILKPEFERIQSEQGIKITGFFLPSEDGYT